MNKSIPGYSSCCCRAQGLFQLKFVFTELTSQKILEVLHSVLLRLLALMLAYIKMGFYKHLFAHLDGSCTNKLVFPWLQETVNKGEMEKTSKI